jgi:hypothetical protein
MQRWIDTYATALQLQVSSGTLTARSNGGGVCFGLSASPPSTLPGFTGAPLNSSAQGCDAAADSHYRSWDLVTALGVRETGGCRSASALHTSRWRNRRAASSKMSPQGCATADPRVLSVATYTPGDIGVRVRHRGGGEYIRHPLRIERPSGRWQQQYMHLPCI